MIWKWAVIIVVGVALVGAVVASATSLTVGGADDLGSGSATVVAPAGIEVTDVAWTLFPANILKVEKAVVTFKRTIEGGDCTAASDFCTFQMVLKSGGTVLQTRAEAGFILSATLDATLPVTWFLDGGGCSGCPLASAIDTFAVTIIGPD